MVRRIRKWNSRSSLTGKSALLVHLTFETETDGAYYTNITTNAARHIFLGHTLTPINRQHERGISVPSRQPFR